MTGSSFGDETRAKLYKLVFPNYTNQRGLPGNAGAYPRRKPG